MLSANLHDPASLTPAFQGANLIFSITDFWTPFFTPANHAKARELNKSIGEYAYDLEVEQGKNIADAAAKVADGLDEVGFIVSTLSNARKCSKGKYKELWHFNSKADVFPDYLKETHPVLAAKTSYLQTGYFMTSWRLSPGNYVGKVSPVQCQQKRRPQPPIFLTKS
jgi:enoyl-[acyl-carrier-protein] reductase (NADH)